MYQGNSPKSVPVSKGASLGRDASILPQQKSKREVLARVARKQLNLSLTQEQYEWLLSVAEEAGEKPTATARRIVVEAVTPPPETDLDAGIIALPPWLLAVLLFLRGHRGSASSSPQQES